VGKTNVGAESFIELYYRMYDEKRDLIGNFYRDTSRLLWNGNFIEGREMISKFLRQLPPSEHVIQCFDVQPMLADWNEKTQSCSILVIVHGEVYFGTGLSMNPPRSDYQPFYHQFTLSPDISKMSSQDDLSSTTQQPPPQQHYYVQYDCMRFMSST
jgi:NTF2-related export protein 1/2